MIAVLCNWWNHPELIEGFCRAVEGECWDELVVMDNASDPDVARQLDARIGALGGRVIHRASNGQVAAATESVAATRADTLVFLNNDVQRRHAGWLARLVAGVAPGVLCGHAVREELGIRYVDGWCLGVTRRDWERLGGYDAAFEEPPYWADVDLSVRAVRLGMKLACVDAGLLHLGSTSIAAFRHDDWFNAVFARNRERLVDRVRRSERSG